MKKDKLPHDVYNCDIWFIRGKSADLWKWERKNCPNIDDDKDPGTGGPRGARFIKYHRGEYTEHYILLVQPTHFTRAYVASMVVHECSHLANQILRDHGVQWDADNDEAYTYYLQWLVSNCLWLLWGKK